MPIVPYEDHSQQRQSIKLYLFMPRVKFSISSLVREFASADQVRLSGYWYRMLKAAAALVSPRFNSFQKGH